MGKAILLRYLESCFLWSFVMHETWCHVSKTKSYARLLDLALHVICSVLHAIISAIRFNLRVKSLVRINLLTQTSTAIPWTPDCARASRAWWNHRVLACLKIPSAVTYIAELIMEHNYHLELRAHDVLPKKDIRICMERTLQDVLHNSCRSPRQNSYTVIWKAHLTKQGNICDVIVCAGGRVQSLKGNLTSLTSVCDEIGCSEAL